MTRFIEALRRFAPWAAQNADGAIALGLAVIVGVLGILPDRVVGGSDVQDDLISAATLVILALVATALLRDRNRQAPVEATITSREFAALPERLGRLDSLQDLVAGTRKALDELQLVRVLSMQEIGRAHAEARENTARWSFKGGTGTYLRAITLPECVAAARKDKRHLTVTIEVIDPTGEEVCETYAHYRRSLSDQPDGTGETWSAERARKESYATVLAAFWHRQRYGLLDIAVGLSATMTTFRWDLSSSRLIMTVEDPNRAIAAMAGTFYFENCDAELRLSLEQARRVPMELYKAVPLSDEPTVEEVEELFRRIGLPLPKAYTDHDVVDVTRKALRAKNPYAA